MREAQPPSTAEPLTHYHYGHHGSPTGGPTHYEPRTGVRFCACRWPVGAKARATSVGLPTAHFGAAAPRVWRVGRRSRRFGGLRRTPGREVDWKNKKRAWFFRFAIWLRTLVRNQPCPSDSRPAPSSSRIMMTAPAVPNDPGCTRRPRHPLGRACCCSFAPRTSPCRHSFAR